MYKQKGKVTKVENTLWLPSNNEEGIVIPDAYTLMAASARLAWLTFNQIQLASNCIVVSERMSFSFDKNMVEAGDWTQGCYVAELSSYH